MKEDTLKHIWNAINNQADIPGSSHISLDYLIKSRSGSIQDKTRILLRNDLILKAASSLAFIVALFLYRDHSNVIYICLAGLLFQAIMVAVEVKLLQQFTRVSDHSLTTRDNLSGQMAFLKRKAPLFSITIAASQITLFTPGVLLYYFLAYGQVKPMIPLTFFVFSVLVGIGTLFTYLRIQSQLKFHIRHLAACLSDLNESTLEFVSNLIEKERKQDYLIKGLVALLLIFGFVALLTVLKSILV
jgi:lipid-A-disaccharide synthase-like uncharacterized protein